MANNSSVYFLITLLLLTLTCPVLATPVIIQSNPETGLKSWGFVDKGLDLKLIQRLPDQTRGFFLGRGFTEQQADEIATNCVFQTVAKNTQAKDQGKDVSIDLSRWQVIVNGMKKPVKLKEDWKKEWQAIENTDKKVILPAQIAFRWATFPSQQSFAPGGDYNWGMISFGLPPGTVFDLLVKWTSDHQQQSMLIKNMVCPEDQ